VLSQRAFATDDMKSICKSNGLFRQMICNLRPLLQITKKSIPTYYKFKELIIDEKLTKWYTDLTPSQRIHGEIGNKLSLVKHEPPQIHNIRIKFQTTRLHENLIRNYPNNPNPQNNVFFLTYEIENYDIRVGVYPTNTVQVTISCTHSPIEYTTSGFAELFVLLGSVKANLSHDSRSPVISQPIQLWRFTHFDFNKDKIDIDCDYPLHDIFGHVQMYTKDMKDGKTAFRVEEQLEPNTTLIEEMQSVKFQKASELF
jgi:hypothetical protein